jgi:hypothetical protein
MRSEHLASAPSAGVKRGVRRRFSGSGWLGCLGVLLLSTTSALAQEASVPQAVRAALPQDMSIQGMIANADWVVKAIIATLAVASVLTWTVALAKGIEFHMAGRRMRGGFGFCMASPTWRMQHGSCARSAGRVRLWLMRRGKSSPRRRMRWARRG